MTLISKMTLIFSYQFVHMLLFYYDIVFVYEQTSRLGPYKYCIICKLLQTIAEVTQVMLTSANLASQGTLV